jgi:hypothetical protein
MVNKKETPVSWLREEYYDLEGKLTVLSFKKALKMEAQKQQKYDEMLAMLIRMRDNDDWGITDLFDLNQLIKEAKEL